MRRTPTFRRFAAVAIAIGALAGPPQPARAQAEPSGPHPRLFSDAATVEEAFHLTGFFLSRHVYEPRGLEEPAARVGFLAALRKSRVPQNAAKETAA